MRRYGMAALAGLAFLIGGCATYYQIREPVSGNVYHTTEYEEIKGGAVKFKDVRTGSTVVIQNSEIREVSEEEYDAGRHAPAKQSK